MASAEFKSLKAPVIITIDGPAGAGKSTVAKELARRLKFMYLDTGAMYRALTLKALRQKINLEDKFQLVSLIEKTDIDIQLDEECNLHVFLDGQDVSKDIRSEEVTNSTFHIAANAGVREIMVQKQRAIAQRTHVVVEGRDIGTVVFPKAAKKFYLDADFSERSKRRILELKGKGEAVKDEKLKKELLERDTKDLTRPVGPLKKADDAILINSTNLSVEQVVGKILEYINVVNSK